MMKTRTISIFTAVFLSFALMFIIPASAVRTWTATADGDITGSWALEFKKGYWWESPTDYTFVDPVSDPGFWIGNEWSGYTDFAGPHTGHVQIYGPSQLEAVMNLRWRDTGVAGDYVLVVRVTYDFSQSPGNLVLTGSAPTEGDHWNMWFYPDGGTSHVVWSGVPSFTITIPLAPD